MSKISDLIKQPTGVYNGHNIQSATVDQTLRPNLNFMGFNITDDPTNGRTNVALPTGSTGLPTVAFSAYKTVTQNILDSNASGPTKVIFETEEFDTNNNYDLALSRFTPTVAGKYLIEASIQYASWSIGAAANIYVVKNGVSVKSSPYERASSAGTSGPQISCIIDMNGSTDYVEMYTYQDTGSTKVIQAGAVTYFQASLLSTNVTHAGYLISPNVGFSAHRNNIDQTGIVTGTPTKILFTTEEYDTNNNFDIPNSRFTPTVAGRYQIEASVMFKNTVAGAQACRIYKNGILYKSGYTTITTAGWEGVHASAIIDMNGTTDYLEIFGEQASGSNKDINGSNDITYFQATLIAATAVYAKNMLTPNVGFSATAGGINQTSMPGNYVWAKVNFATEEYDINNNYDIVNSRFTPTVAGKYLIESSIRNLTTSLTDNDFMYIGIYKNGTPHRFTISNTNSQQTTVSSISEMIDLNGTTDYIEIWATRAINAIWSVDGLALVTYFQAQLLSATTAYSASNLVPSVTFKANMGGINQSFIGTSNAKIAFNVEEWDTNNNFDTTLNRFTPTVAGKYLVDATLYYNSAGSYFYVTQIYKNGSLAIYGDSQYAGASSHTSAIVDMNGTTDYIEIYGYSSSGSSVTISGAATDSIFQASLLSTTSSHAGYLLSPNVGFSAHKNGADQTGVLTGVYTKIAFTTEEYDTNNNFDTTNSRFTPTVAGRYTVDAGVWVSGITSGSSMELCLYKNGIIYKETTHRSQTTSDGINAKWVVDVNGSTDYLELYFAQSSGNTATISGQIVNTYFQANLLSATAVYAKNMLTPNVGFSANKGGVDQTGAVSTQLTKIIFTNEVYDTNNNYDVTNSKFIPTIAGKYLVTLMARSKNQPGVFAVIIQKNGITIADHSADSSDANFSSSVTCIIDMNGTTDYLEANIYHNLGVNLTIDGTAQYTFFQAQILSATTAYSGYNMAPSVSFSAYRSTPQSGITNNTSIKILYDAEEYDTNNNYDTILGRFTPTVPGKYLATASAGVDGSYSGTNIAKMYIFKNGVSYKSGDYRQFTTDYFGADVTCIVDMNGTTDYIEAFFMQRTSGDRIVVNTIDNTYFQASLLSTTTDINSIQGPQGVQGASIQGPQGYQGTAVQGPQGASIQGPQGAAIQGAQGPQGAAIQGPQGPQGASGTGGTGGGSASNFTDLLDVPNSYSGQQGKSVIVNNDETGLIFTAVNASAIGGTFANPNYDDSETINIINTTFSTAKLLMLS
jgi:hypothetical protein